MVCIICICGAEGHISHHACQACGVGSVLPSCGFWGSNSTAPLPASHLAGLTSFTQYGFFFLVRCQLPDELHNKGIYARANLIRKDNLMFMMI